MSTVEDRARVPVIQADRDAADALDDALGFLTDAAIDKAAHDALVASTDLVEVLDWEEWLLTVEQLLTPSGNVWKGDEPRWQVDAYTMVGARLAALASPSSPASMPGQAEVERLRTDKAVMAPLPVSVAQESGDFYESYVANNRDCVKAWAMAHAWEQVLQPYLTGKRDHSPAQARPTALDRIAIAKALSSKTYAFPQCTSEDDERYDCGEWEEMGVLAQATYLQAADAVIAALASTTNAGEAK